MLEVFTKSNGLNKLKLFCNSCTTLRLYSTPYPWHPSASTHTHIMHPSAPTHTLYSTPTSCTPITRGLHNYGVIRSLVSGLCIHPHPIFHTHTLYSTPTPYIPHPHPIFHTHTLYSTPTPYIPHPHPIFHTHTLYSTPTPYIPHPHHAPLCIHPQLLYQTCTLLH